VDAAGWARVNRIQVTRIGIDYENGNENGNGIVKEIEIEIGSEAKICTHKQCLRNRTTMREADDENGYEDGDGNRG